MPPEEIIAHWKRLVEEKWQTTQGLYVSGRRSDALFYCSLTLECKLKELVAKATNTLPPITHDLVQLALEAHIMVTDEQKKDLEQIATFNIRARYDDYKDSFYKRATEEFTKEYFEKTKALLSWLSSM